MFWVCTSVTQYKKVFATAYVLILDDLLRDKDFKRHYPLRFRFQFSSGIFKIFIFKFPSFRFKLWCYSLTSYTQPYETANKMCTALSLALNLFPYVTIILSYYFFNFSRFWFQFALPLSPTTTTLPSAPEAIRLRTSMVTCSRSCAIKTSAPQLIHLRAPAIQPLTLQTLRGRALQMILLELVWEVSLCLQAAADWLFRRSTDQPADHKCSFKLHDHNR